MIPARTISPETARRFLVQRHFLVPPRSLPAEPASVMTVVGRLGSLQFDPLDIAGRNHDLVLLSRIAGYRRAWTDALLYDDRSLFEAYNKGLSLLPMTELPWYRATWDRARARHEATTFVEHREAMEAILSRIEAEGVRRSTDFDPGPFIDWYWRPTRRTRALLEALAESGILGLAGRDGNQRLYDLAERLFPADLLAERRSLFEQRRHRLLSRYRGHGMLGRTGSAELFLNTAPTRITAKWTGPLRGELLADLLETNALAPIQIEGLRGERFVLAEELGLLAIAENEAEAAGAGAGSNVRQGSKAGDGPSARSRSSGRSRSSARSHAIFPIPGSPSFDRWSPIDGAAAGLAFLAPLDPFVWDREFLRQLFGFDYVWEVYVPESKREWGYYVLPILYGERLVGRIEPRLDRDANTLRILSLHWQDGFEPLAHEGFAEAFARALDAHRRFLGVRGVSWPRSARDRSLGAVVRGLLAALAKAPPEAPSSRD